MPKPSASFARRVSMSPEAIKWNFTKFLVDRSGKVVHRFAPATRPDELVEAIETLL